jgi:hypothetical protein
VFTVDPCPFRGYRSKSDRISFKALTRGSSGRSTRTSKQAVSSWSTEEYRKSACEDLTCD